MSIRTFVPSLAAGACALALALGVADASPRDVADESPASARSAGAGWLVQNQNPDGGWGSGGHGRATARATSDVATTSLAVLALMRDANGSGAHKQQIERGVEFVVDTVDASPLEGPRLAGPDGTQPQYKLGRNVDTHFAALLFGEVSGSVPPALDAKLQIAYDKVLTKVVAAQQADGSFDSDGWAPVLSSSVAAQSLYRAHERGKKIELDVLEKSDDYQSGLVDEEGRFDTAAGAGVRLYSAASSLSANRQAAKRAQGDAKEKAEKAAEITGQAVASDRGALMAGFGSVGGEEMLSYMMISDSLAEEGGDEWKSWESKIGTQLSAIQNGDGSWSGHHCITSTPFVTAAAVMTLGSGSAAEHRQVAQH